MGLTLVTAPVSDPVTLAEAKAHCRLTNDVQNGLLAGYLMAARQYAETYTRRAFVTQTWDYTIDDDWPQAVDRDVRSTRDRILLPKAPAQSVSALTYFDTSGIEQTLATDQYRVLNTNQERGEAYVDPAYGIVWPAVRRQSQAITVRFVCGYDPVLNPFPEPIRQAILMLAGHWFEVRETVNIGNITTDIPFATEALLFPYRIFY